MMITNSENTSRPMTPASSSTSSSAISETPFAMSPAAWA